MEKLAVKLKILESVEQNDWDKAIKLIGQIAEEGRITEFNGLYLNELVKMLADLKLSTDDKQILKHKAELAYIYASRL